MRHLVASDEQSISSLIRRAPNTQTHSGHAVFGGCFHAALHESCRDGPDTCLCGTAADEMLGRMEAPSFSLATSRHPYADQNLPPQYLRRLCRDDGHMDERSGLNHRDDPAGRVEVAPDSRLTYLDAALPRIVYAHGERGRKRASAIPVQRTGACRAHTHGAKG